MKGGGVGRGNTRERGKMKRKKMEVIKMRRRTLEKEQRELLRGSEEHKK